MDLLFETCWNQIVPWPAAASSSPATTMPTASICCSGSQRNLPEQAETLAAMLRRWGGNSSGVNIANIDNLGNVHPDTMWWDYTLGSVKERPFSEIWDDISDPLMAGLKRSDRPVEGRCAQCVHLDICGGNSRTRAWQLTGNPWAEDPGCYLNDDEIGVISAGPRASSSNPTTGTAGRAAGGG